MNREKFKQIRVNKGYTQKQLASHFGYTVEHISRLENGHVNIPKLLAMAMLNLKENKVI